ncbi:MAG: hypothetical protein J0M24_13970 [Verrucomicrobia bacterium]|nr:hypothetical protein [Verrucomicrobiota bacterium]
MTYSALDPQANRPALKLRAPEFRTVSEIDAEIERLYRLRATLAAASAGPSQRQMLDVVVEAVCQVWGITRDALLGRGRLQPVSDARQAAMYVMYLDRGLSSSDAGALFNRDHGTVLHAVFQVEAKWSTEMGFRRKFDALRAHLGLKPWLLKAGRVS